MTIDGFFSVVQKPRQRETKMLTVRGRSREDLVRLIKRLKMNRKIYQAWEFQDYEWRVFLPASKWAEYVAECARSIDYDNFKSRVNQVDPARHDVYSRIWGVLHGISDKPALRSIGKVEDGIPKGGKARKKRGSLSYAEKYPDIFQTNAF